MPIQPSDFLAGYLRPLSEDFGKGLDRGQRLGEFNVLRPLRTAQTQLYQQQADKAKMQNDLYNQLMGGQGGSIPGGVAPEKILSHPAMKEAFVRNFMGLPAKPVSQRKTRTTIGPKGGKWTQEYNLDPTTMAETPVGEKYQSGNAPVVKKPSYQLKPKTWADAYGTQWSQERIFNPETKEIEDVGKAYQSGKPPAYQETTRQGVIDLAAEKAAATAKATAGVKVPTATEKIAQEKYGALVRFMDKKATQQDLTLLGFDKDPFLSQALYEVRNDIRLMNKTVDEKIKLAIDYAKELREASRLQKSPNINPDAEKDALFLDSINKALGK